MPKWIKPPLLTLAVLLLSASATAQQQLTYRVIDSFPHDRNAFTQGLVYFDGKFYESIGLYGRSELREVELNTGRVLRKQRLLPTDFGEGLARVEQQLVQLTWTSGYVYLWDLTSFTELGRMPYRFGDNGEAARSWGLCYDGSKLILSDGSASLYFLDPDNHELLGQVEVRDANGPVPWLNELECIGEQVYANVWRSNRIIVIEAANGQVTASADLTGLYPLEQRRSPKDLMNGIAWDKAGKRLFVTGKNWPKVYHIALEPAMD